MKSQLDFTAEIAGIKRILDAVKNPQKVSSANAVFYVDTRSSGLPLSFSPTLAASATIKYRLTYSHPLAVTPYAAVGFDLNNVEQPINYVVYRSFTGLSNQYQTVWEVVLRNIGTAIDTFDVTFSVESSAPGTLTGVVI